MKMCENENERRKKKIELKAKLSEIRKIVALKITLSLPPSFSHSVCQSLCVHATWDRFSMGQRVQQDIAGHHYIPPFLQCNVRLGKQPSILRPLAPPPPHTVLAFSENVNASKLQFQTVSRQS